MQNKEISTLKNSASYLDKSTGKNSLHLVIDDIFGQTMNTEEMDEFLSAIRSICKLNTKMLYQLEYENYHTPLAYLLSKSFVNLECQKSIMFEFLSCGASLTYAMKFTEARKTFEKIMLYQNKLEYNKNTKKMIMLTAFHIGRGVQCVGEWSKTLPLHVTATIKNAVYKKERLELKDFDLCIKRIEKEKYEAAEKRAIEEEKISFKLLKGSFFIAERTVNFFTKEEVPVVETITEHAANAVNLFAKKQTPEQEQTARLEKQLKKAKETVSADTFFSREIKALCYDFSNISGGSTFSREELNAAKWLASLRTDKENFSMFQLIAEKKLLDSKVVYLVDTLLQAGLHLKYLEQ